MDELSDPALQEIILQTNPRGNGIFWRGPSHSRFIYYGRDEWDGVANGLLDGKMLQTVTNAIQKATDSSAHNDSRTFAFCWVKQGPVPFIPMFFAEVSVRLVSVEKRRSERIKRKSYCGKQSDAKRKMN